jgi:hypothetical protein
MRIKLTRKQTVLGSALSVTIAAVVATALWGSGLTGAWFKDTHNGAIDGTIGNIRIDTSGGTGADGLNFNMANMLPGTPQSSTLHYTNTTGNAADVWLVFPNATALSSINDYGHYAEMHVVSNGTEIFGSANLNDHASTCPNIPSTDCRPLPNQLKLASNLASGASGTAVITFDYTGKLSTQPAPGTTEYFNEYPQSDQTTIKPSDGTGHGLPLQVVATQPGQSAL